MNLGSLSGRTAWITGGATGIGREVALALADAGAHVAIGSLVSEVPVEGRAGQNLYRPSPNELADAHAEIERKGIEVLSLSLDVRSNDSVRAFYDATIERFGKIDILVNAAGAGARHPMQDHPDELWHDTIDINLNGPYRTTKLCFPGMVEQKWGRIVNIASTAANVGFATYSAYCASKAGLLGLTRCVALEGAEHGITCNAINPGTVASPSNRIAVQTRADREGKGRTVEELWAVNALTKPQKRLVPAREVAAVAAFLCSEAAASVNMEDIDVAGGALW